MDTLEMTVTPSIFLTDYASYNEGTQFEFGHWIDLSQFSDADELAEYIAKHFQEADKKSPLYSGKREEIMITDYEGFPEFLYSESMSFEKVYEYMELMEQVDLDDESDLIRYHNIKCDSENNSDDCIHDFDEEFFETYFSGSPMEASRATQFGEVNWNDQYITFNGYGNLKSINNIDDYICKDELILWLLDNPKYIGA